ncbi:neutral zinc metallopeptidase [Nocardiopsis trehalosi]|uniref:neutral zinc metallopeptidase n=1 Tax=Nocardiopsis trehalosi TaxID=109329 RepID=UPI000A03D2BD|nr:neutral zinc metallopeptidase [Nocardiopsis trehalosi]
MSGFPAPGRQGYPGGAHPGPARPGPAGAPPFGAAGHPAAPSPQAAPWPPAGASPYPGSPYGTYWPPPPPRRHGGTAVWAAVGGSSLAAFAALLVCVALVANAPSPTPGGTDTADPAPYYSRELSERPHPIEVDVAGHPVYDLAVPERVDCELPDLDPQSASSWEGFSEQIGGCLNEMWQPRLEELGLRTEAPTFHVTEENPDQGSPEEGMTLAYYEGDRLAVTVVLPNVTLMARDIPDADQEAVWAALLGHEYGHHVQQATGILDASYEMERGAASQSEELEALRRTELQAECMGGIAMSSLGDFGDAEIDRVNEWLNGGSDLPTHGSATNRQYWFDQGATLDTIEACNTYAAPDTEVR